MDACWCYIQCVIRKTGTDKSFLVTKEELIVRRLSIQDDLNFRLPSIDKYSFVSCACTTLASRDWIAFICVSQILVNTNCIGLLTQGSRN